MIISVVLSVSEIMPMSENWDTTQLTTVAWFLVLDWRRSEDQPPVGGPRCISRYNTAGQCVIEPHHQLIISETNKKSVSKV